MTEADASANHEPSPSFELNVSLPTDARFAPTARALAVQAARQAGCSDAKAHAFGDEVEEAIRGYLQGGGAEASIPLVVRRTTGPVEVLIHERRLTLEP